MSEFGSPDVRADGPVVDLPPVETLATIADTSDEVLRLDDPESAVAESPPAPAKKLLTAPLTLELLDKTVREARAARSSALQVLIDRDQHSELAVAEAYSRWLSIPHVKLDQVTIEPDAIKSLSEDLARRHVCMPVKVDRRSISIAMGDPSDFAAIQAVQFSSGLAVVPLAATRGEILRAIDRYYNTDNRLRDVLNKLSQAADLSFLSTEEGVTLDPQSTRAAADAAPVVQLCNGLLLDAVNMRASDLHVEPEQGQVVVRCRVDGKLREHMRLPKWLQDPVTVRFKILAALDIAERRLPQDGRIRANFRGRSIDIRVATLKTHYGEKIVLRLLGGQDVPNFRGMGLTDRQIRLLEDALGQPQGMILVTGPTGAGKTTTLYSMLNRRRTPDENIITIEDPIEYQIPGINQVQVNVKAGLTFAKTLRSILRQDPDVLMVGEMRDLETAEIAFRAAMTGHLVLSTLHTNSAPATIIRLLDLGVDPVLVGDSLHLIVAQRLLRRLCVRCKVPYVPTEQVLERLRIESTSMTYYKSEGCEECSGSGFAGRIGVWEMLPMGPTIRPLVMRRAAENEIAAAAEALGMRRLIDEAIERVRAGITSPDEVCRVVRTEFETLTSCPSCDAKVEAHFAGCPYCMAPLRASCLHCGTAIKPGWRMCPHCMTPSVHDPLANGAGAARAVARRETGVVR